MAGPAPATPAVIGPNCAPTRYSSWPPAVASVLMLAAALPLPLLLPASVMP
jgi:hypothetical protein